MEIKLLHFTGIAIALVGIISWVVFSGIENLFFIIGVGVVISVLPFVFSVIIEGKVNAEKEEMFLEFSRNLVESVKTGTPVSKSIVNLKGKSYGYLTQHIEKLANQISLGIPLNYCLQTFSRDVNNKTISRALTLIGEAERSGGEIGEVLESVAAAIRTTDKLKKERKAAISSLVVQGYIIFFVFLIILLIMQFSIIPMTSDISGVGPIGGTGFGGGGGINPEEIANAFLYLLLVQGFFSGLTIGKLSEGNIKAGIKHSFSLMLISFLVSAGVNFFF